MAKPVQSYEGDGFTVTFDPNTCTHSAACIRGLPQVFDVKRRPWITPDAATAQEVEAQIGKCPSGALQFKRK